MNGGAAENGSISIFQGIARYQQIGAQDKGLQDLYYVIDGLEGSIFEGCKLQLQVTLNSAISIDKRNEFFTPNPPTVRFLTIPFHPNVEWFTGKPCVEGLLTKLGWRQWFNSSIDNLAIYLQWLLSNPATEPDPPVNADAARMIAAVPEDYVKMVGRCTAESRRLFYRYQRTAEREAAEQSEQLARQQAKQQAEEAERRKQFDEETMKTVKKQAYYLMYGLFKDFGKRPQKNQQLKKRRPAIDVAQLTEMLMKSAATRRRGTPPSTAKGIGAPPTSKGGAGTQFQSMVVVNVSTRPATTARQESELADNNDSEEEDDDLNLIKWSQSLPIEST